MRERSHLLSPSLQRTVASGAARGRNARQRAAPKGMVAPRPLLLPCVRRKGVIQATCCTSPACSPAERLKQLARAHPLACITARWRDWGLSPHPAQCGGLPRAPAPPAWHGRSRQRSRALEVAEQRFAHLAAVVSNMTAAMHSHGTASTNGANAAARGQRCVPHMHGPLAAQHRLVEEAHPSCRPCRRWAPGCFCTSSDPCRGCNSAGAVSGPCQSNTGRSSGRASQARCDC